MGVTLDDPWSEPGEPARREGPWRRAKASIRRGLPHGSGLPPDVWARRHRAILILLWVHVPILVGVGLLSGYEGLVTKHTFPTFEPEHVLLEVMAIVAFAALASFPTLRPRARAVAATLGLGTASALLVHFSGGLIEAHFHFFVMIGVIATYQDWLPFSTTIAYVALHHGIAGTYDPAAVYNHPAALAAPWRWAILHASFIFGLSIVELVHWKSDERARERSELLLDSAGEGILGIGPTGRITFANRALSELTGRPATSYLHADLDAILRRPEGGWRAAHAPGSQGARQSGEACLVTADGEEVPVEWLSTPLMGGGPEAGYVLTLRDLRGRRRAEAEIAASNEGLEEALSLQRATLEATADGILVVNGKGALVMFNRRFQEMWRIPDEIVELRQDQPAIAYVLDQLDDPQAFLDKTEELYAAPEAESYDELRFKDGRIFERYSRPQRVAGQYRGRVWSFRDVTAERAVRRELAQRVEDLTESNAELERFAYVASHDLREPLRTVTSYVQLLERRYAGVLDEDARVFIAHASNGARRMDRLIQDLLTYSRIERSTLEPGAVDPRAVLDEVLASMAPAIAEEGAVIEHGTLPPVLADPTQLGQVLQNLLSNALKFRREGEPARVRISAERTSGTVTFSVADRGVGIEPAYAERIFVLFQRLDHARPGSGVGLAICKKLVERNGGRIWVEPSPEGGAMFRFTLPAAPPGGSTP